jgi:GDP-D-glucose phosphorylase
MGSFIIHESRLVVTSVPAPSSSAIIRHSEFDRVLKSRWKEAADSAVCFYRLDRLQNKVIAGKYGFVAQVYTNTYRSALHLNSSITRHYHIHF